MQERESEEIVIPAAGNGHYAVMEKFYTLQGEGYHCGKAAYFIRLAGCDVGCVWCDVKESWHTEGYPVIAATSLAEEVKNYAARIVVVTGGEPYLHDIDILIKAMHDRGLRVHVETSGTAPFSGNADWICLSPKKFKNVLPENLPRAHELKVVVYHESDLEWAESFVEKLDKNCQLFLQPEWSRRDEMTPRIIAYIQENPHWTLSLQTHKYIGIP